MSESWLDLNCALREAGVFIRRRKNIIADSFYEIFPRHYYSLQPGDSAITLLAAAFGLISLAVYLQMDDGAVLSKALIINFFSSLFAMATGIVIVLAIVMIIGMLFWSPIKKDGWFTGGLTDLAIIVAIAGFIYLWWKVSFTAAVAAAIIEFVAAAIFFNARTFLAEEKKGLAVIGLFVCLDAAIFLFIFPYSALRWHQPAGAAAALAALSFGGGILALFLTARLSRCSFVYNLFRSFWVEHNQSWSMFFSTTLTIAGYFIIYGAIFGLTLLCSPLRSVLAPCWRAMF
jgi:hypothetical protein